MLLCYFLLHPELLTVLAYPILSSVGSKGKNRERYFCLHIRHALHLYILQCSWLWCDFLTKSLHWALWGQICHILPLHDFNQTYSRSSGFNILMHFFSSESQKNQYTGKQHPQTIQSSPVKLPSSSPLDQVWFPPLTPLKSLMSLGYPCRAYPAFKHAFTTAPSFKRLNNKQHFPRLGSRNLSSKAGCLPCLDFQREQKLWGHPKTSVLPSYPGWWGPLHM